MPGRAESLRLSRRSPSLRLLQRARDEAHRFGLAYNRQRRTTRTITSELLNIPGVGPNRRRQLLERFGSLAGVKSASVAELATVPGFSTRLAERILSHLNRRQVTAAARRARRLDPRVLELRRARRGPEGLPTVCDRVRHAVAGPLSRRACPPWSTAPSCAGGTGCGASDRSSRSSPGEEPVTLGEGDTPLLRLERDRRRLGVGDLWVKDEGANPTGSFKARGLGAAVTRAVAAGAERFVLPTAGNAGVAAAAYGARAGRPGPRVRAAHDAADHPVPDSRLRRRPGPARRPHRRLRQARRAPTPPRPARSTSPPCASRIGSRARRRWASSSRCSSDGRFPHAIIYPDRRRHGPDRHVEGVPGAPRRGLGARETLPRMYTVQSTGCAPVVRAFAERCRGSASRGRTRGPSPAASGCPAPLGGRLMLRALRESGGGARRRRRRRPASGRRPSRRGRRASTSAPRAGPRWPPCADPPGRRGASATERPGRRLQHRGGLALSGARGFASGLSRGHIYKSMADGRFAILDPAAGISGDMLLGALVAAGAPADWLEGSRRAWACPT